MTSILSAGMRDEERQENIHISRQINISLQHEQEQEQEQESWRRKNEWRYMRASSWLPIQSVSLHASLTSVVFRRTRSVYCCPHGWGWMTVVAGSSDSTVSHSGFPDGACSLPLRALCIIHHSSFIIPVQSCPHRAHQPDEHGHQSGFGLEVQPSNWICTVIREF